MSLSKENKYPEIRFKGFTEAWEQRKLDELVFRKKSYPLSRSVETSSSSGYKYIHYGDIHTKVANIINKNSKLPNIKSGDYELLKEGDLILADASEDYQGIAMPSLVAFTPEYKLVAGLHTIVLRPIKEKVDPMFLYYLIKSPIFRKYGYRIGTGMKVFGISITNVLKFDSLFPSLKEQQKISSLLISLDNTIALHQQKLDQLNKLKTIYLQAMLSTEESSNPKIRFNNFKDEWKQRKLKDITEKGKSYSLSRNSETNDETGYKYIHYGDIHKKVANIITQKSKLPNIEVGTFEFLEEGDLVLADASEDYQGIAKPSLLAFTPKFKLIAGLHTIVLKPNKEIVVPLFLYYLILSPKFRRYGYRIGTGMKVFGISAINLTNFKSAFPVLKEQAKVSNFLLSLDNNITLQNLKIIQLKKIKKVYLQKMFV